MFCHTCEPNLTLLLHTHMPVCNACCVSVLSPAGYRATYSSGEGRIINRHSKALEQRTLTIRLRRRLKKYHVYIRMYKKPNIHAMETLTTYIRYTSQKVAKMSSIGKIFYLLDYSISYAKQHKIIMCVLTFRHSFILTLTC